MTYTTKTMAALRLDEAPAWQDRADRTPVPMVDWGKDHWRLLQHVEVRIMDYQSLIGWDHIQVSRRNWPMLYAARRYGLDPSSDGADYGLRLRRAGGETRIHAGHCEVDALMDLVAEGVLTLQMPRRAKNGDYFCKPNGRKIPDSPSPSLVTGAAEWALMPWARFSLTAKGRKLTSAFREYRQTVEGATFSGFSDYLEAKGLLS